jgi:hypothetical protein
MPRFTDEWVIDRVLFDYVAGGQCACCGLQHFLPNSTTADLIAAVSDIETDAANSEVAALAFHPWPVELRDQIWADRVRLRQRMKRQTVVYRDFWQQHGVAFTEWCRHGGGCGNPGNDSGDNNECLKMHTRWLQLPRSEVMEFLREEYKVHAAFAVVLCTVLEQVAAFNLTQYPPDGRGAVELNFERILYYDRRGGFTLNLLLSSEDDDKININEKSPPLRKWNEENLNIWLEQMKSLGGPKLLERGRPSTTTTSSLSCRATDDNDDDVGNDEDAGAGDADDAPAQQQQSKSSFQSDRRILRLLIARYWANIFQQKYLASISSSSSSCSGSSPNEEASPTNTP